MVCVNETFLNKAVEDVDLEGYTLVGRRDRSDGRAGGGIAAFAFSNIAERISLINTSDCAERFWLLVHAEQGPHLVGVWYRPPNPGEVQTVNSFKAEMQLLADSSVGNIVVGDLNVHNKPWLRHSSHNSLEGKAMQDACDDCGLEQKVRQPTREGHLLDLVVTDIPNVVAKTLPAIADHKLVMAEINFKVPEQVTVVRTVWLYYRADWERMRQQLAETDWGFLETSGPHAGAKRINDIILEAAERCIPKKTLHERKTTHPWLAEKVEELWIFFVFLFFGFFANFLKRNYFVFLANASWSPCLFMLGVTFL